MKLIAESVLPPEVRSVPTARRVARQALHARFSPAGDPGPENQDLVDQIELIVSELVTNAVVHAGTDVVLRVLAGRGSLRIEVGDGSRRLPTPRDYAMAARTGRGLQLVERSVEQWGVHLDPDGKTVWAELSTRPTAGESPSDAGQPDLEPAPRAGEADAVEPVAQVVLRRLPVLMHWAWQEHAQALLREYLLFRLDEDPAVLEQHAESSEALGVLYEQIPQPNLPDDPDALLADTLEPEVTLAELVVSVPATSVPHFATLELVLGRAVEAASAGLFLGPPTQPEIEEMRAWLCDEVSRQARGGEPTPWRTRMDVRAPLDDPLQLEQAFVEVIRSEEHVLVTNEASVIVAVSDTVVEFLGYRSAADLVGRRVIVVVPERYHQAHIAGTTLNATNGRDHLLDVRLTVPLMRADGVEAPVGLRVTPRTVGEIRVFVADITFDPANNQEGTQAVAR